jgi:quinol monooxygenase YgiN
VNAAKFISIWTNYIFSAQAMVAQFVNSGANMTDTSNTAAIVVLEAFEHVHPDRCDEYETAGVEIDNKVKETEPGMLVHALTCVSKSSEAIVYRWLEIFDGATALAAHFDSPAVKAHIEKVSDGILVAPTDLVLYTNWSEDEKEIWKARLGGSLTFAPVRAGYYLTR